MRRYADPVEVRRGILDDSTDTAITTTSQSPRQFLWRGRLWKVRAVLAHWVETGPWWQSTDVGEVIGDESGTTQSCATQSGAGALVPLGDLLAERELWRVEAGRGRLGPDGEPDGGGVFDLSFDWVQGRWILVGCSD